MHAAAQSGKNSIAYCLRQLVRDKAELPTLLENLIDSVILTYI